jgi:hypothetical protein
VANPLKRAWGQATHLAEQTPESRNRYVDFLRAASIIVVICGHWLVVAPYLNGEELLLSDILSISPWTQWLTWALQVMPIFFIVGGFSNATSWRSAQRRDENYSVWLNARLRRLISPVLPVLVVWTIIGIIANLFNTDPTILQAASRFALLPAWFLVVYIVVVAFVPLTYRAWERFQLRSFWALVAGAALIDLIAFAIGLRWAGWFNYVFIWLAVHQIGFAWQAGHFKKVSKSLLWALGGILALSTLVYFGPYPVSMVSVQGEEISNTLPPNLTMLALGIFQGGLLLSLEKPLRKWLDNLKIWTSTVLINGMIMTLFLWHVTILILIAILGLALGGLGLRIAPGTSAWWLTRPIWILILGTVLLLVTPIFVRYERIRSTKEPVPLWRSLAGGLLFCVGLAILTLKGITAENWIGIRIVELVLPFIGANLLGLFQKLHQG